MCIEAWIKAEEVLLSTWPWSQTQYAKETDALTCVLSQLTEAHALIQYVSFSTVSISSQELIIWPFTVGFYCLAAHQRIYACCLYVYNHACTCAHFTHMLHFTECMPLFTCTALLRQPGLLSLSLPLPLCLSPGVKGHHIGPHTKMQNATPACYI